VCLLNIKSLQSSVGGVGKHNRLFDVMLNILA